MYPYPLYPEDNDVSCHVCLEAIPTAGEVNAEAKEYLFFFCGQGCYVQWQPQVESRWQEIQKRI